ncbi:helix-turn-helix domain-containing protein [Sporomusa sp. KB1]|jgi:hypothetical protein|uniref:helix-turn-helix domain-containing protein n=1 Tax=Sporomusa sp. KB1 TaxID=943346 RepID=UPI0011A4091D|nr:helix-turn-helix domain-containing protein [Sporomusa sp. KB1]TWH47801.1 hypothetical protein Salpa_3887 [Sporomusa sp. KB1]
MNGITTKEAAEKWGITTRQVQLLCANGCVPGVVRFGHAWVIPADAIKPKDGRSEKNLTKEGAKNDEA